MATQIILSKLTNLVIPDEIIFDIDKMVYHAKHAVHHGKVMDELIFCVHMVAHRFPIFYNNLDNYTTSWDSLDKCILLFILLIVDFMVPHFMNSLMKSLM